MIELKNLSIRRDGRVLFSDVNIQIHPQFKVGLTGNNGTGKSSFFALLLGELSADVGNVSIPSHWHIGHMAQEIAQSTQSALDFVLSGDATWYTLNHKINNPAGIDEYQLAKIHSQFDDIHGYGIPAKASTIMAGLGFSVIQESLPVESFSGGWRMRLNLAKTLMSRADLLLLDEPTNHLDLDAILWLENWLQSYHGTLIIISHDQAFLDNVVGHILHIEHGTMTLYTGNYSTFMRTYSERLAQKQQQYDKQQATKAHLENFIRRFRAKATKAKQAQSRIKQLERMSELAPVMANNPFDFRFYPPANLADPLIVLDNVAVGYDGNILINHINLRISPDSRIGLLGMNGAGKSTVIKSLVGELAILSGTYKTSDNLLIGYFNQHQMDSLDGDATPMLLLQRLADNSKTANTQQLRNFLGGFDFCGDTVDTPCRLFSGGERARLTLALIVYQRPNVLILDEPTNHLDLQMRQALSVALQDFLGAVVLVSHDRELIKAVCDELYLVHDGQCKLFDDDMDGYGAWLSSAKKQHSLPTQEPISTTAKTALTKEQLRKKNAQFRQLTAPIRKDIDGKEKQLTILTKQLAKIERQLGDGSLYDDNQKITLLKLLDEQSSLKGQIALLEDELIDLMLLLEEKQEQITDS